MKTLVIHPAQQVPEIRPYLEIARQALADHRIKALMDAPLCGSEYDGDLYFTIEHNDGTFDMVQLYPSGEVKLSRDILREDGKDDEAKVSIEEFGHLLNSKGLNASKVKRFRNVMVTPQGDVFSEDGGEKPYFHSKFFSLECDPANAKTVDESLPDGGFVHTKNTKDGTYILIVREIK